jgi:hypothetical protein
VGAVPPAHFIVAADPFIVNEVGIYPVEPWVTNTFTVKTLPSVVGAFVICNVIAAEGVLVVQKIFQRL